MGFFRRNKNKNEKVLLATAQLDFYCLGQLVRQGQKLDANNPLVSLNRNYFIILEEDMEDYNGE